VGRFRKKPVEVEAMQYPGLIDMEKRGEAISWLVEHGGEWRQVGDLHIVTLEGEMMVRPGWWIIRGIQGEFYPCAPDIFEATYEPVAEGAPSYEELVEILAGVCDCAVWQSGAVAYAADSAWPEMREKMNRGLDVVGVLRPEEALG
jgi:hypothetical protein